MKITICGPAASGKGTIARRLATEIGIDYVDLGLLFRFGAFAIKSGEVTSIEQLADLVRSRSLVYSWGKGVTTITLHNSDITLSLLSQEIAQATSVLAADANAQRELTVISNLVLEDFKDVICDGRNAGTTILSDANYKLYVTAHLEERARRRHSDILARGDVASYEEVLRNIEERDERDCKRKAHPLVIPKGAIMLETDTLSVKESVLFIREMIGK